MNLPDLDVRSERVHGRDAVQAEIAALRPAMVDDAPWQQNWLQVSDDGTLTMKGYLADARMIRSGGFLVDFVVTQDVGGVGVFHVVPLVVDTRTSVSWEGQPETFATLVSDRFGEPGMRMANARFHLAGTRVVYADALEYLPQEVDWGGEGDDYPPSIGEAGVRLLQSDGSLSGDTTGWLAVASRSSTESIAFQLAGYLTTFTTIDPPERGVFGYADIACPDSLGGSLVFHVVRPYVGSLEEVERLDREYTDGAAEGWITRTAQVHDGRVWIAEQSD